MKTAHQPLPDIVLDVTPAASVSGALPGRQVTESTGSFLPYSASVTESFLLGFSGWIHTNAA